MYHCILAKLQFVVSGYHKMVITFNCGICRWLKSCFFKLVSGSPATAEPKSGFGRKALMKENRTFKQTAVAVKIPIYDFPA